MTLWLVRAGKYGEYEPHFLEEGVINLNWEALVDTNLGAAKDYEALKAAINEAYPNEPKQRIANWAGQISAFVLGMTPGDWIALPRRPQRMIAIGKIVGPYTFSPTAEPMERHGRKVEWLNKEVPRSAFGQDLLYSFGAFLTICEVKRNNADARVRAMALNGWRDQGVPPAVLPVPGVSPTGGDEPTDLEDAGPINLEQVASDQIAARIQQLYSGHGMARLVAAILEAQGYTTHVSPPGPDRGVDILAAPDALGFGSPRICVQVKSGATPVDRPTLDQLIGVMQNVHAEQGLLVSWGGFRSSVERETASQFFRVRLWDAEDVIEQLLAQYDRLPAEIRQELPLKQIWTVAPETMEDGAALGPASTQASAAA
jgi:restriction system protein